MLPCLYVISDGSLTDNIAHTLKQCLDNGTPWVGIREYARDDTALNALTEDIVKYAEPLGAMVSIWGRTDIAEKFAIGCHLSHQTYTPQLKSQLNCDCPLGVSTHTQQDIKSLRGCDYVTLSPVFNSISKSGYMGMGVDTFANICTYAPMPVFALGGITAQTAPLAFEHGAYGIALCGSAMQNPNIITQILADIA